MDCFEDDEMRKCEDVCKERRKITRKNTEGKSLQVEGECLKCW